MCAITRFEVSLKKTIEVFVKLAALLLAFRFLCVLDL
jgi:hypothetical protein